MTTNHRIRLNSRPVGAPTAENFLFDEVPLEAPGEGQVLLRTLYLSLDPYMRGRMSDAKSYAKPVEIGEVMVGATVSEVIESNSPDFDPGDIVLGYGGWQEYSIEYASQLRRIDPEIAPVSTALGVLGMPGFTAYAGLLEIGMPKPGETVAVAAASGPVGSVVGQIANIVGATSVGIAGGPAKVNHLKELGFDIVLDHRSPTFKEDLAEAVPQGIDVYFENVGGKVFEARPAPAQHVRPRPGVRSRFELQPHRAAAGTRPHRTAHEYDPAPFAHGPRVHPDRIRRPPRREVHGRHEHVDPGGEDPLPRGHPHRTRPGARVLQRAAHRRELRQDGRRSGSPGVGSSQLRIGGDLRRIVLGSAQDVYAA